MLQFNYNDRLTRLKHRRFDVELQKADLSASFGKSIVPQNLEYLIEAMRPIDNKYNTKTVEAATNVQSHLERALDLDFKRAYRMQGSVTTNTNIKLYSDIDLLVIIDDYQYLEPALLPPRYPYQGAPHQDIDQLRSSSSGIMRSVYDEVDTTGSKSIEIYNKNLKRKVDLVFSFWYDTQGFLNTRNEYFRGIYLFDNHEKQKELDFPFAHIQNVNNKAGITNGGLSKAIRLLKTLKVDADREINLSSFQLTSLVYAMDSMQLYSSTFNEINLAQSISLQLGEMISNTYYRESIKSPNGLENPFDKQNCISELQKLKNDLDILISDCKQETSNQYIQKSIQNYKSWN